MHPKSSLGGPRRVPSSLVLAAVPSAVIILILGALPAQAHDELASSSPSDGEVLTSAPEELVFTFTGEIQDLGLQVQITSDGGDKVAASAPVVEGAEVTVPLEEPPTDADLDVTWRVVSADGHPISGQLSFTVDDPSPGGAAPAPPADDEATTAPIGEAEPETTPDPSITSDSWALGLWCCGTAGPERPSSSAAGTAADEEGDNDQRHSCIPS